MATIIVFFSSLLLATILVSMKARELKREKQNFLLGFISKLDPKSEKFIAFLKFKSLQTIQTIRYIILVETKEAIRSWFYDLQEKILNEYRVRHNIIMGQKEIAGHGSASFYLRKITEQKSNGHKGKIEGTL